MALASSAALMCSLPLTGKRQKLKPTRMRMSDQKPRKGRIIRALAGERGSLMGLPRIISLVMLQTRMKPISAIGSLRIVQGSSRTSLNHSYAVIGKLVSRKGELCRMAWTSEADSITGSLTAGCLGLAASELALTGTAVTTELECSPPMIAVLRSSAISTRQNQPANYGRSKYCAEVRPFPNRQVPSEVRKPVVVPVKPRAAVGSARDEICGRNSGI